MKLRDVYKCEHCGNIVEILHSAGSPINCCGEKMVPKNEQIEDSSKEKHVPFIIKEGDKVTVKVGENTNHPMSEYHYIEWIEIIADGITYRQHLNPGDEPVAVFYIKSENVTAREYCNIHSLWKS